MGNRVQRYIIMQAGDTLTAMYIAASHASIERQRKSLEDCGRYERVFIVAEPGTIIADLECAARETQDTLEAVLSSGKVRL